MNPVFFAVIVGTVSYFIMSAKNSLKKGVENVRTFSQDSAHGGVVCSGGNQDQQFGVSNQSIDRVVEKSVEKPIEKTEEKTQV